MVIPAANVNIAVPERKIYVILQVLQAIILTAVMQNTQKQIRDSVSIFRIFTLMQKPLHYYVLV